MIIKYHILLFMSNVQLTLQRHVCQRNAPVVLNELRCGELSHRGDHGVLSAQGNHRGARVCCSDYNYVIESNVAR